MKESIFNVLGNSLENKKILDLFAGTGSLGLEALSRNAEHVYFIDRSPKAIRIIRSNIDSLKIDNSYFKILRGDSLRMIKTKKLPVFDLVFLDPPYNISKAIMVEIFKTMKNNNIIDKDSLIIYEFFFKKNIEDEVRDYLLVKESSFGDKIVRYFKKDN